jgi:hypothetical protein
MESYETWRAARPHPPSNPFGDALPPRPQKGGGEDDEKARSRKSRCVKHRHNVATPSSGPECLRWPRFTIKETNKCVLLI